MTTTINPVVHYRDLAAGARFLVDAFGFVEHQAHKDDDGKVQYVELSLDGAKVEVFPEFVTATLQPHPGDKPGLYDLILEVPAGVPACQYHSNPLGRVRIDTGHPRIGQVELGVSFAVLPRS